MYSLNPIKYDDIIKNLSVGNLSNFSKIVVFAKFLQIRFDQDCNLSLCLTSMQMYAVFKLPLIIFKGIQ